MYSKQHGFASGSDFNFESNAASSIGVMRSQSETVSYSHTSGSSARWERGKRHAIDCVALSVNKSDRTSWSGRSLWLTYKPPFNATHIKPTHVHGQCLMLARCSSVFDSAVVYPVEAFVHRSTMEFAHFVSIFYVFVGAYILWSILFTRREAYIHQTRDDAQ